MFTRKPGLLRRRNRAVTLIEAVLYISIALALIVGGLVFFQQASTAAKTSATVRQLSAVLAETRVLIRDQLEVSELIDITPVLIAAGAVPPDMVKSATELSNPFGGETEFYSWYTAFGSHVILINLTNVPQGVCARLLTATSGSDFQWLTGGEGSTTAISYGYATGSVTTPGEPGEYLGYSMNPTQAGWMCKYGSAAYTNKTIEPTAPPLSGNVIVSMFFLADR
jgi:type II secretory pathway pseudopilin PulG